MKKFRLDIETGENRGKSFFISAEDYEEVLEKAIMPLAELSCTNKDSIYPYIYQIYDCEEKKIVWDFCNGELK